MKISPLLRAAALSLPLFAATPAGATVTLEAGTTPKMPTPTEFLPQDRPACRLETGNFFSDTDLERINAALGRMRNWLSSKTQTGDTVVANYISRTQDAPERQDETIGNFKTLYGFDNVYKAGTPQGLEWLKQDPIRIMAAVYAFDTHATSLRAMDEVTGTSFRQTFAQDLSWMMGRLDFMQNGMAQQINSGCTPSPAF